MNNTELMELRQRNEERAKKIRESMGTVWLCHPSNHVKRLPKKRVKKTILSK